MDLPRSIKNFKQVACDATVIPFPNTKKSPLETKKVLRKPQKSPCWLVNITHHWPNNHIKLNTRKIRLEKISKLGNQSKSKLSDNFAQIKAETEIQMLELFNFFPDVDILEKMNLLKKFNQKIISGEIKTTNQMKTFLLRAEELAKCIKLYLLKNEYSENFKDVSFDVFEQGFSRNNQESIRKKYPNLNSR